MQSNRKKKNNNLASRENSSQKNQKSGTQKWTRVKEMIDSMTEGEKETKDKTLSLSASNR